MFELRTARNTLIRNLASRFPLSLGLPPGATTSNVGRRLAGGLLWRVSWA